VHARNHKIELAQDPVRIIERSVAKYVRFDSFKDAEGFPVPLIKPVGLAMLLSNLFQ
jgi:hypothetical protein